MIKKAMIFAAGLGSRLKPWTDFHPKALAVVNGKSLLQRNIEYLQGAGITNVVVNVHHFAEQIIEALKINSGWGSNYEISDESASILETGGGLERAKHFFANEENILIINADILTNMSLQALINQHEQTKPLATLATTKRETSRYFLFNNNNELSGWRNSSTGEEKISKQTAPLHPLAFSGIHIINNQLLSLLHPGKYSMVDVYLAAAVSHTILSFNHTDSLLLDVGKPESLAKAASIFI